MKKLLLFTVALLTSFYAFSQDMFDAKTIEELEKSYSSAKQKYSSSPANLKDIDISYSLCKKFIDTDFSKMSYDEAKNLFIKTDEKIGKNKFFQIVLFSNRLKHLQKDVIDKDGNQVYVIRAYPIYADKNIYGTAQNYNKALMKFIKYNANSNNLRYIQLGLKKFNQIQDELKTDEIKESLKYMKRYIYPKITEGDEWKQLATKIELQLKALE